MILSVTIAIMDNEKIEVEQGKFETSRDQFVRVALPKGVAVYLYSKEKALELAEKLKQAAEELEE